MVGSSAGADWDVPVAYGVARGDLEVTAQVEGGRVVVVEQAAVPGEDLRGFAMFLPSGGGDVDIVATDPSDREMAREAVPVASLSILPGDG